MITTKELVPIKKKIEAVAEKAKDIAIRSSDDMATATVILSQMNGYMDSVKEKKETLTKPLNEALKNARAMFKPLEETYEEAIEVLREKMSFYQTQQMKIKREEELKIASRVKEGKGNLSIETAVKKIEALPQVNKEVATDAGLVQFREVKVLVILDPLLIPREYLVIDESRLLKDLKEGKTVAGATTETKQVAVNYR